MASEITSEREAFEKWVQGTSGWKACKQRGKPMHLRQNRDGSYNDFRVNDRWHAWQARAHLAQPAQAVERGVQEIPAQQLVRRAISSLKPTRNFPLLVRVMDTFALGSTYASELCLLHGFNPDAKTRQTMCITAHLGAEQ